MTRVIDIPRNEKGYARYSYSKRPPDLPGFRIIHVRAHMRGLARVDEHWYYTRTDELGLTFRGATAREKMEKLGIRQTNAPPEALKTVPDTIGHVIDNLKSYDLYGKRMRKRIQQKESVVNAIEKQAVADSAQWVPVYFVEGGRIEGWFELGAGCFYALAEIEPGMPGVVRRDMKLIGNPSPYGPFKKVEATPEKKPRKPSRKTLLARAEGRDKPKKNLGFLKEILGVMKYAPPTGYASKDVEELLMGKGFVNRARASLREQASICLATNAKQGRHGIVKVSPGHYRLRSV